MEPTSADRLVSTLPPRLTDTQPRSRTASNPTAGSVTFEEALSSARGSDDRRDTVNDRTDRISRRFPDRESDDLEDDAEPPPTDAVGLLLASVQLETPPVLPVVVPELTTAATPLVPAPTDPTLSGLVPTTADVVPTPTTISTPDVATPSQPVQDLSVSQQLANSNVVPAAAVPLDVTPVNQVVARPVAPVATTDPTPTPTTIATASADQLAGRHLVSVAAVPQTVDLSGGLAADVPNATQLPAVQPPIEALTGVPETLGVLAGGGSNSFPGFSITATATDGIAPPSTGADFSQVLDEAVSDSADSSTVSAGVAPVPNDPGSVRGAGAASVTASPNLAEQIESAIVGHAKLAERSGAVEFEIRLDPPHLGPMTVKLKAVGDRLSAVLEVSSDAVRRVLESQLPELRQRLEAAGVNLPNVDVNTGGGGSQDPRQPQEFGFGFAARATAPPRPAYPSVRTVPAGRLDVVA